MKSGLSVLMAFAVMSVFACTSGESTGPGAGVGTYQLVSVNGTAVPVVTLQNGTITQEVLSGSLTIAANGTFTETRNARVTLAGGIPSPVTATQTGTWEIAGDQVTFTVLSSGNIVATFTGSLSGEDLTYTSQNTTFVYTKLETT